MFAFFIHFPRSWVAAVGCAFWPTSSGEWLQVVDGCSIGYKLLAGKGYSEMHLSCGKKIHFAKCLRRYFGWGEGEICEMMECFSLALRL